MQVIPIASGKGGVGKTLVAANLAIALGKAGKKLFLQISTLEVQTFILYWELPV